MDTRYDAMGRPLSVRRKSLPDTAGVGVLTDSTVYDRPGRATTAISQGTAKTYGYDPAGNPVLWITRRGHHVQMQHDALARLVRRTVPAAEYAPGRPPGGSCGTTFPYYPSNPLGGLTVPAENFLYRYDAAGNQVWAENLDARVSRTYYPGGALKADTTRMRSYGGMDYAQHVYGLEYRYDTAGRLCALRHPLALTGSRLEVRGYG